MCYLIMSKELIGIVIGIDKKVLAAINSSVGYRVTPNSLTHTNQKAANRFCFKQTFSFLSCYDTYKNIIVT